MELTATVQETRQHVRTQVALLFGLVFLIAAGLMAYSQTMAFTWDEGFHIITAQMILRGRRPYLDFLFPQTDLNAYWNAGWMRLFGESWRVIHTAATLCTVGALALMTDYMYRRAPAIGWRLAATVCVVVTFGLNAIIMEFGTLGQAYGFCLLMEVIAFRFVIRAVESPGWLFAALAGFFASAAAGGSLLTSFVAPVMLIWMLIYNQAGKRAAKLIAFLIAVVIPFTPMLYPFAQNPKLVRFSIIDYDLIYRQVQWSGAIAHDVGVLLSWVNSGQAVLLLLLGAAGLLYVHFQSGWSRARRAEVYLCVWLAAAIAALISSAHPTFGRYYLLCVPFLTVPAAIGLYSVTARLYRAERPWPAVALVAFIFVVAAAAELWSERGNMTWPYMETVAQKVDEVTPRGASLLADEHLYFLTKRMPPSGMELWDSHKLEMKNLAGWAHFLPWSVIKQQLRAGVYVTAETCHDEPTRDLGPQVFEHHADMDDCDVYWTPKPQPAAATAQ
ncbi:MAG TPA: hypothetical protein VFA04_11965 [Bryobacteraceae bacterium]|nr:hypothetical protein [Bryobacteraceae bacterium]